VAELAGAKEPPPAQPRASPMQGQVASVPVGDARLPLLMQAHQQTGLVAVYESCCPSRTNRRYEMRVLADAAGVRRLSLVLVRTDSGIATT
jgi:hypothetical protein